MGMNDIVCEVKREEGQVLRSFTISWLGKENKHAKKICIGRYLLLTKNQEERIF